VTSIVSGGRALPVPMRKEWPLPTSYATLSGPSAGWLPLLTGDGMGATFEQVYKSQPFVYAIVQKLVYGIARNPLKVYEYLADGESRGRVRAHPLAQLIRRPYTRGSEFGLKSHIALDLHVHGHALLLKSRPTVGAPPTELWPVPWRNVQVESDERGPIGYAIQINGVTYPVGPEDVVHISLPGGISPLVSLRGTVALEEAAATFQRESLANGVSGGRVVFKSDQAINDQAAARLRLELERLYAGAENAGRFAILGNGLDAKSLTISASDLALIEQRKLSREEVAAAYDVALQLIGVGEKATYGNVAEYRKALYDAIAVKLTLIEDALAAQLVDPEPAWDGVFCEFDTGGLLRPDPEARARTHMLNMQSSTNTINERRKYENLPPIDDPAADTVFVPANMAPAGAADPNADPNAPATPAQGFVQRGTTVTDLTAAAFAGDPAGTLGARE
jgi:HK97 family phage portal protein